MADVNLSKAVRTNLLSLQSTAASMAKTQNRLATGLKVNSALDNPSNFFTASALNSRASDMSNLLDSMSSGIKTIEAADNGLKAITKTVEAMQSTLRQARQDKSYQSTTFSYDSPEVLAIAHFGLGGKAINADGSESAVESADFRSRLISADAYSDLDFTGVGASLNFDMQYAAASHAVAITATGNALDVSIDGNVTSYQVGDAANVTAEEMAGALTSAFQAEGFDLEADVEGGNMVIADTVFQSISDSQGINFITNIAGAGGVSASDFGFTTLTNLDGDKAAKSVDAVVQDINSNDQFAGKVRASNDNGRLRIENLTNEDLEINLPAGGGGDTITVGGNNVRQNLVKQFNDLRDQLDKLADDASFNGINLLRGDKLKLTFNETGSSTIEIQAKDPAGQPTSISSMTLGIEEAMNADFASDANIDTLLDTMKDALGTLRSQASAFGSNLSVVENRTDFAKNMINTLETGAANLTLADTNEEAANLLALQTRQQLSSTALSMASQADQAVLRLF